jgi:hypothetical protein
MTLPDVPENKTERKCFFNLVKVFLRPFIYRFRNKRLLKKWSHHADPRSFNWEWESMSVNRIDVVQLLISKFEDPTYLEIGCAGNELFDSINISKKIGVDPASGGNVRKTSDAFFENNNNRFDVVFIDGLHEYEQIRRDFINSIKYLNDGGWIAIHDMLPRNWIEQHVPSVSMAQWTGNGWKIGFELLETLGIEFKILKLDCGVGVIKVIDSNAVLKDLRNDLSQKEFSYFYENFSKLPVTEWSDAQEWLRS